MDEVRGLSRQIENLERKRAELQAPLLRQEMVSIVERLAALLADETEESDARIGTFIELLRRTWGEIVEGEHVISDRQYDPYAAVLDNR